jgi:hypothetical protein
MYGGRAEEKRRNKLRENKDKNTLCLLVHYLGFPGLIDIWNHVQVSSALFHLNAQELLVRSALSRTSDSDLNSQASVSWQVFEPVNLA